ncbi:hypothetical protein NQ317_002434 [Molorchus minor]|uniref:Uncharacterized protein n=1 Tax=Molorchus minor TaxID=1323400 RepID=A0ABQ9IR96_9CUCU|nr:hypothetical protein NQ317_002434 [Molorchus minor]
MKLLVAFCDSVISGTCSSNQGPGVPPPQRYQPQTGMRQYGQQSYSHKPRFCFYFLINEKIDSQRTGYNPTPPNMTSSGGTMIQRPAGAPYSPMRGGPMPQQPSAKRPNDSRVPCSRKRNDYGHGTSKKKKKLCLNQILPQKVRDLVQKVKHIWIFYFSF